MRPAFTLLELLVALALIAALLGIAAPRFGAFADRAAVHAAAVELAGALDAARRAALVRGTTAALLLDTARAGAVVVTDGEALLARRLDTGEGAGVRLRATRDTIRYGADGRAVGASNATLVVERGRAADTLWVSRLGRVRSR